MRKTKIVCTLGPATADENIVKEMMLAGMNIARFNFSHGDHAGHKQMFDMLVHAREELDLPVAALLDTKGPEIRLGQFEGGRVELVEGQTFLLTTDEVLGTDKKAQVSFEGLPGDVKPGDTILIDDGLIELRVQESSNKEIACVVVNGGPVSDRKGVNVPGITLSMEYLSKKDREDIIFGIETGFDFLAASFVRTPEDIMDIRKLLKEHNCKHMKIIAKLENLQGVKNLDAILKVSDGVMVARGDMGVEIKFEDVPVLQKKIIKKCYEAGKYVITATQMLDSMMKNPRPTRAEAADVANAIYDGTSAIMLSGETAAGKYPILAVKTMALIAERAESDVDYRGKFYTLRSGHNTDVTNAISHATCTTAYDLEATAIITVTQSGKTARMISKYRPSMPIIGCATDAFIYRQLSISWGVQPVLCEIQSNTDELFNHAVGKARDRGFIKDGDLVVITAGIPLGVPGTTNMVKVQVVGDILISGYGIGHGKASGKLCVAKCEEQARRCFQNGDILVLGFDAHSILDLIRNAKGIIIEDDNFDSFAAIAGAALDIPVIMDAKNATDLLRSGTVAIVDADAGIVSNSEQEEQGSYGHA